MNGYYDSKITAAEDGRRLTVTLPPGRRALEYQIEMIANNDVFGLLAFRYLTTDAKPCFHYDINGLVTLQEYMPAYGQSIRFLAETLMDISVSIGGLDKFLLEEKCLLLDTGLIFIDPSRKGIKLAYLPVEPPEDKRITFSDLVMDLIGGFHPEDATGKLFCRRIIEEVKKAGFRYETFTDFLLDILCFSDGKTSDDYVDYQRTTAPPAGAVKTGGVFSGTERAGSAGSAGSVADRLRGLIKQRVRPGNEGDKKQAKSESRARTPARGSRDGVFTVGNVDGKAVGAGSGGLTAAIDGKNAGLLTAFLAAAAVAVVYFGVISFIPFDLADGMMYRSAALILALGAEMFLLKYFAAKGAPEKPAGNSAPIPAGAFAGAVQAASALYDANAAADDPSDPKQPADLWAGSVQATGDDLTPETDFADGGLYAGAAEERAAGILETDPPTEVLPCLKRVDATLTIRDSMREFGVTLTGSEFTIGRKKEQSDLALDNPAVGKQHAKLVKDDDRWYVRDLYSKNGTYLNNIKLENGGQKILNTSDLITVANVDMIFTPIAE